LNRSTSLEQDPYDLSWHRGFDLSETVTMFACPGEAAESFWIDYMNLDLVAVDRYFFSLVGSICRRNICFVDLAVLLNKIDVGLRLRNLDLVRQAIDHGTH